jgi:integrase
MAEVVQRVWKSGPRKVRRTAWGYTVQVHGKQERKFNAAWTKEAAHTALAARLVTIDVPSPAPPSTLTFAEAVDRYLTAKARKGSLSHDRRYLVTFLEAFGATTPVSAITAARINAWRDVRLSAVSPRTGRPYAPGTINRALAVLQHLLRLAVEEWDMLTAVPKIRRPKEPQGRLRWLEPDEEARLLTVCRASQAPMLITLVTVALESGMHQGEITGLEWPRVDLSRGVFKLEVTKGGKRREVPMRQGVYEIMAGLPGPREGRVWTHYPRRAFEHAVKVAGLEDFHFHDCRHHFASWFIMRGGSLPALQKILGHATLTMTMRYAHLSPDHLRAEMAKTELSQNFSTSSTHSTIDTPPEGANIPEIR